MENTATKPMKVIVRCKECGWRILDKVTPTTGIRDCNDEILEKVGIESDPILLPDFSCHNLRHTFATRLCESGINLKVIQDVLGHADVKTTMNIYVDVTKEMKKKEIASFGSFMANAESTA